MTAYICGYVLRVCLFVYLCACLHRFCILPASECTSSHARVSVCKCVCLLLSVIIS